MTTTTSKKMKWYKYLQLVTGLNLIVILLNCTSFVKHTNNTSSDINNQETSAVATIDSLFDGNPSNCETACETIAQLPDENGNWGCYYVDSMGISECSINCEKNLKKWPGTSQSCFGPVSCYDLVGECYWLYK